MGFLNTATITDEASLQNLPEVLERFRGAGIDEPTVIAPDDDPVRAAQLQGLGLSPSATRPVAFINLGTTVPQMAGRVQVRPVNSREERARFLAVLLAGYDAPSVVERFIRAEHPSAAVDGYLAWVDEEAVAAAAMTSHDDGVVLGGAATIARHRGSGAQTALLHARLAECASRDLVPPSSAMLAAATAAPGSPSLRNLERAGFTVRPRRAWRRRQSE